MTSLLQLTVPGVVVDEVIVVVLLGVGVGVGLPVTKGVVVPVK